ncbi:hypothetical protein D3C84_1018570 [compost metagenome]
MVETGHQLAQSRGNQIAVLPEDEQREWMKVGERLNQDWIDEVEDKGYANGATMLDDARQLIDRYSAQLAR